MAQKMPQAALLFVALISFIANVVFRAFVPEWHSARAYSNIRVLKLSSIIQFPFLLVTYRNYRDKTIFAWRGGGLLERYLAEPLPPHRPITLIKLISSPPYYRC